MFRSLRKGRSSIYLQHEHTGHSIGAEQFEAQVDAGKLVLRFVLKPVDSNQRQDEDYLHEHPLESITLHDSYVIDQLRSYVDAKKVRIESWEIEIASRSRRFHFQVSAEYKQQHAYQALLFAVRPSDA